MSIIILNLSGLDLNLEMGFIKQNEYYTMYVDNRTEKLIASIDKPLIGSFRNYNPVNDSDQNNQWKNQFQDYLKVRAVNYGFGSEVYSKKLVENNKNLKGNVAMLCAETLLDCRLLFGSLLGGGKILLSK